MKSELFAKILNVVAETTELSTEVILSKCKSDECVAARALFVHFCKSFSDEDVLRIAYDFYFADEDWKGSGKIWTYMSMNV